LCLPVAHFEFLHNIESRKYLNGVRGESIYAHAAKNEDYQGVDGDQRISKNGLSLVSVHRVADHRVYYEKADSEDDSFFQDLRIIPLLLFCLSADVYHYGIPIENVHG